MNRLSIVLVFVVAVTTAVPVSAQQDRAGGHLEVLRVRDNIYLLAGKDGNTTVQTGPDGILVVDTKSAERVDQLLDELRKLSALPLRYIINTHFHADHTGGNVRMRDSGSTIAGGNISMEIGNAAYGAQIVAHENVLVRLSSSYGSGSELPPEGWPTSVYFTGSKNLYFNGEGIQILHVPAAHTDGDSMVYFRHSDVIVAGDIMLTTTYPYIDTEAGGTYQGILDGLNILVDMMIPEYGQDDGTLVIPGHGRICDVGDVINYREMLTIIRDRIVDMIGKGMTLKQVREARPTFDYDGRWGIGSGSYSTDDFIEAAYHTLGGQ